MTIKELHDKKSPATATLYTQILSASFQNISWSAKAGIAIIPSKIKLHPD
jgi:hypothetical protein